MPPDLTRRPGGRPDLLAAFGTGPWTVLPSAVAVAVRPDGDPDLLLELVRPERPVADRDEAYAMLDLRLELTCRTDDALAEARAADADAAVVPAALGRGWLRFVAPRDVDVPGELLRPVALGLRGLGDVRWTMRLSASAGALLHGMLVDGAVPLGAVAQLELSGIAPRIPLHARASRRELLAALATLGPGNGLVALDAIVAALRADPGELGFELLGDAPAAGPEACAQVLSDLIVARIGSLEPGAAPAAAPVLRLSDPEAQAGVIERDLREPFATVRPLVLRLDPLAAARSLAGPGGAERLVRETVARRFDPGLRSLRVVANLPANRVGLLALGARVTKEAAPPARVQAAAAAARFAEPDDEGEVSLRLAPGEAPEVDVQSFAVVRSAQGVYELRGSSRRESGGVALVGPDDVPLRFVNVSASAALLALADVAGDCRHGTGDGEIGVPFVLSGARPACSIALPIDAAEARLLLELRRAQGAGTVALAPLPATDVVLDLAHAPGWGRHEVRARCRFTDGQTLHAIEVLPEASPTGRPPQVVTFTPERPERAIAWFAPSPFEPGFRHRPHAGPGAPDAPWSEPHPPFEPLELSA